MKKFGFSFSIKRFIGISGLKNSFAQTSKIPTTKEGLYRKIGRTLVDQIFK